MSEKQVFLIDAYGLIYRAYYAVKSLTNSKGQPTNAVYGFCNILRKLLADFKPTHLAVCFDMAKKTLRQEKYADYKAHRQAMPDDLIPQIDTIRDIVKAYNIPIVEMEGHEADDIMATLAKRFGKQGTVIIVTEDKDMGQLVTDHVKIYSARQEKIIEAKDVKEKFGVNPNQIVDYIAIAGDTSDNIPGVKGIGEVGAKKLLEEFGTLENIYKNLESIKAQKLREKLEASKADAFMSQELATLHPDVDVAITFDDIKTQEPNRARLLELFQDLEFKRFAQELSIVDAPPVNTANVDFKINVHVPQDGGVDVVYDLKALLKLGGHQFKGKVFDVYLAGYLLSGGQKFDVSTLAWNYLKSNVHADILKDLYAPMHQALKDQGLDGLYYNIELPLVFVLNTVEHNGVKLDRDFLLTLSKESQIKIEQIQQELFKSAGCEFNMNSPKQLSEILFEKLKLPVIKKTKTGFSTDEEVLTRLAEKHPLPALILEYRQIAKLKSTYIDALPLLMDPKTNKVHATFNQAGAETGRLSSHNPNLQNIPIRTDLGKRIRQAFIAFDDHSTLLSADYSQIELRILAHLSNDENLIKAFQQDQDIHRYTASLMFDVKESEVDDKMRYAAKRINFGIIYGMSAFGLSKDLDVSVKQAQDFIDRYFLRYPKVHAYLDGEVQKARDVGYSTTMFNRRRYLPDINNRNVGLRQFAERQAINAPIQGTAADLIKKAMVDIDRAMHQKKLKSLMIMTVHDELVFNVHLDEEKEMIDLVKRSMEEALELSVPIRVTVKIGQQWLNMSAVH